VSIHYSLNGAHKRASVTAALSGTNLVRQILDLVGSDLADAYRSATGLFCE
jgi:hypothetical protein